MDVALSLVLLLVRHRSLGVLVDQPTKQEPKWVPGGWPGMVKALWLAPGVVDVGSMTNVLGSQTQRWPPWLPSSVCPCHLPLRCSSYFS